VVTVTRCVTNFVLVCFGDQKRAEKRKAFCECHRNTTQPARHAKYLLSEFKCAFGRPISFLYTVGLKTAKPSVIKPSSRSLSFNNVSLQPFLVTWPEHVRFSAQLQQQQHSSPAVRSMRPMTDARLAPEPRCCCLPVEAAARSWPRRERCSSAHGTAPCRPLEQPPCRAALQKNDSAFSFA
jgi:hypothetical protein